MNKHEHHIFRNIMINIHTHGNHILENMKYLGKDLIQFSKETVLTFYNDAKSAKYKIT